MREYRIAHVREQGQQMIIIPLERDFEHRSPQEQQATVAALQAAAIDADLAGAVVVAWQVGQRHKFIAPPQWQRFFSTLPWHNIVASLNKTLRIS